MISAVDAPNGESPIIWKVIRSLLLNSWVEFEKVDNEAHQWNYKLEFVKKVFELLERVIDHYNVKLIEVTEKQPNIGKGLVEAIASIISSTVSLIYQSSITKNYGCE